MIDRFMKSAHCISLIVLSFLGGKDFCLHALDKVRDPEYLKTCYQCTNEQDTVGHALSVIYHGGEICGDIDREAAHVGFLAWKRDAEYLSSDDFFKQLLSSEASKSISDFKLWMSTSLQTGLFDHSWYEEDGAAASVVLENMRQVYENRLSSEPSNADFFNSALSKLEDILNISKGFYFPLNYRK